MDTLPDIDRLLSSRAGAGDWERGPDGPDAAAWDAEVVAAMLAVHRAGLYRLACAMLHDPDEAEDAVQQAFLQAALNLGRYQPGSNFKAWLYTIAVNACRGLLRKRKARRALARLLGAAQRQDPPAPGPERALVQDEADRRLWDAVAALDEPHRLVVHLRYGQDLSIAEIAQVLSIRQKTVYSRLYAALGRLRRALADEETADQPERWGEKELAP